MLYKVTRLYYDGLLKGCTEIVFTSAKWKKGEKYHHDSYGWYIIRNIKLIKNR